MKDKIDRIVKNERAFNQLSETIHKTSESINDLEKQISNYAYLLDYYTSQDWRDDVAFSDSGEFPKNIPHGILSEDGFFNEVGEFRDLALKMLKVSTKMLEI